jgi:hypothetical protein
VQYRSTAHPWLLTVDDGEVKASMETKKPDIKRREASTIPRGSRRVIHTCTLQQQPMACIKMRGWVWIGSSGPRSQVLYWFLPCKAQTTPRPLISVRLVLAPPRPQQSGRACFLPCKDTSKEAVVVSPTRRKMATCPSLSKLQTVPVI